MASLEPNTDIISEDAMTFTDMAVNLPQNYIEKCLSMNFHMFFQEHTF